MIDEPMKENPCDNFSSYAEERDASVVVAHLSVAFPFDVYQLVQLIAQQWSSMLVYLCWDCISTWSLARRQLMDGFL